MLKFLNNRTDQQRVSNTGISKKPSLTYGVSADSPSFFSNKFTAISDSSSINPHYKYEEERLKKISQQKKMKAENNQWRLKSNLNLIQEEKILKNKNEGINENSITNYHSNHEKELIKNSTRYRLVKGEFSGFIHEQHKNQIFGPLQGQERTLDRANITKLRLRQESISSLQKLKSNPSLLSTYRPSNKWLQIKKLRKSRDILYNSVKIEQEQRRYKRSPDFQLPRVIKKPLVQSQRRSQYFKMNTIDTASYTIHLQNFERSKKKQLNEL